MKLSIISFTMQGLRLSQNTAKALREREKADVPICLYTRCSAFDDAREKLTDVLWAAEDSVTNWAEKQMQQKNALLFIGASGIAVRAIAPWIKDKTCDSPVLVMDEMGKYVIPLLSGHLGGANALAKKIAEAVGAEPVITTATDLQHKFAVDLFAKRNGFAILNKEGIAGVSAKRLQGETVTLCVQPGHMETDIVLPEGIQLLSYPPEEGADICISCENIKSSVNLFLKPREYVLGVGCRKGKSMDELDAFIRRKLAEYGLTTEDVYVLASIDCKKEEAGLVEWSTHYRVPFQTFDASTLQHVNGDFRSSPFVESVVGVDNVCERAALAACEEGGSLLCTKQAEEGMTIAIAKRRWSVRFDEE